MRPFVNLLLIALCAHCSIALADETQSEPRIEKAGKTWKLILPPAMNSLLEKQAPDFKIYKLEDFSSKAEFFRPSNTQLPFAVIGDFNGDGKKDIALFGSDNDRSCIIALVSTGSEFKIYNLKCAPSGIRSFLALGPKKFTEFGGGTVRARGDTIRQVFPGQAESTFYFNGTSFVKVTTAD